MNNHKVCGALKNTARGKEWNGRDEEVGHIQGWVLWASPTPRWSKVLARHIG